MSLYSVLAAPASCIRLHFGQRSVAMLMMMGYWSSWTPDPALCGSHGRTYACCRTQTTDKRLNFKISLLFASAICFLVHKSTVNECHAFISDTDGIPCSTSVKHTKVSQFRNVTKKRQQRRGAGAAMGKGGHVHVTHMEDV